MSKIRNVLLSSASVYAGAIILLLILQLELGFQSKEKQRKLEVYFQFYN